MKNDPSFYFYKKRLSHWPLGRALTVGVLVLALACGGIGAAAMGAGSLLTAQAESTPAATPTAAPVMTPDPAWQNVDWRETDLSSVMTPRPKKDIEVQMELSSSQQSIGVDLYYCETDEAGKAVELPLTGVEVTLTLTCESLSKVESASSKKGSPASKKGAVTEYPLDTATGSLLIPNLDPGVYTVAAGETKGCVMPQAQQITVKEKVSYVKVQNVKVEQSTPALEKEDQTPAKPVATKAPDSVEYVKPSEVETTGKAYVLSDATRWAANGETYLLYADGSKSPFKANLKTDAKGVQYVLSAAYDASIAAYLAMPATTATPTAAPAAASLTAAPLRAQRSAGLSLRTISLPPVAEETAVPVTETPTAPPTEVPQTPTEAPPAETAAPTAVPPAATDTPATASPTPDGTPDGSAQPSSSPTVTGTPEVTATPEATATALPATPTPVPSATPSAAPTATPIATPVPPAVTSYTLFENNSLVQNNVFLFAGTADIVAQVQYSGWQTLAGKTYYYDPQTNKPVTGAQIINGTSYLFNLDGVLSTQVRGIDVSKYQASIDWNQVKAAGIEFVIIRAGYRGYGSGTIVEDPMFRTYIQGASAAGLRIGVYFFSQAVNEQEAVEEASACLDLVRGYKLSYPIFFDSEYSTSKRTGRADKLTKAERTACAVAFCETVRSAGFQGGVYASENWFANQLSYATVSRYTIWNAHYGVASSGIACSLWQYTGSGSVAGISKSVDMNLSYMG